MDRSLIRRIAERGDIDAFETLYHSYRRRLGPFMYRVVSDDTAREEVFNDVMMTVWRKSGSYRGGSKVSTWIFSIAYRQCIKALRRMPKFCELEEGAAGTVDHRAALERTDLVRAALRRLKPEHRLVVELAYFQGNNYKEIAEIAACPENTVKTRIFYARRRLQGIMAELGEDGTREE